MQQLGLNPPTASASPPTQPPQQLNIGGLMSIKPLSTVQAEDAAAAATERAAKAANEPVVQGLVGLLKRHWDLAKQAKQTVETEMLEAVRSRNGQYPPTLEAELEAQGGSQIYMMLFASKARQAKALLADVMIGSGAEKPWTLSPSSRPDLPPESLSQIAQGVEEIVAQAEQGPNPLSVDDTRQLLRDAKERLEHQVMASARDEAHAAETKLEDVLVEGGYLEATDGFLDDLTTFHSAFIKGPVIVNEPTLTWTPQEGGTSAPVVTTKPKRKWLRVDPFMMYPAPWAKSTEEGFLIERHRLDRGALSAMIGVEGYNEDSIRAVLAEHGNGGLHEWLMIDTARESAESRSDGDTSVGSDLIDALQYWGSVSGKMLREWGMKDITDDAKEYQVECWLIGQHVIKAVINPDPLARRPYYSDGYSRIPGAFWHKSLYMLVRDCQSMCNAAARALANNLGISSGPQVGVNVDRMATGEEVTEMFPWKIWQFTNDPMGSTAAPITFFQPSSNASELIGVYDKFSVMADEYSGIPRYMTGTEGTPGAGRTASGLSMMVGNASKVIKSLVSSLDLHVTTKNLARTFDHLLQYDKTFQYRGDLQIVPRGALSLQVKGAAAQAQMQFLQATANPLDMQIVGIEGRAAVLREVAKSMNLNTDAIVPSLSAIRIKEIQAQQQQMMEQQAAKGGGGQPQPQQPAMQTGNGSGQVLMDGSPQTDNFSPMPA